MKVLVIGGTGFVGRHICDQLLKQGHEVTLFNRGRTAKALFPECEQIIGDREISHEVLIGRTWDAAIDTNGRSPAIVNEAARILKKQVGHYSFISSISAYDALQGDGIDLPEFISETSQLATLAQSDTEDLTPRTYGARKARCEKLILESRNNDALIIRPGLIVGPWDTTDRFTYWPVRVHEGGQIITPGTGEDLVRFIDVRDLAVWLVNMIEGGATGIFNCTGPEHSLTIRGLIDDCQNLLNSRCKITWCDEDFLKTHGVMAWSDMPVWAPKMIPIDSSKAITAGLRFRPLSETIVDTLKWADSQNLRRPLKAGLTKEREDKLLQILNNPAESKKI
jgi:2'-hydroxyisoflavone reductase